MYIPESEAEKEFLEKYDPTIYARPSIAADTVLFAFDGKALNLLLIERGNYPYKGKLALPGGFANVGEDIDKTASRELLEETGIEGVYAECFTCLGSPERDPRYHTISPEYFSLVRMDDVEAHAGDDAAKAVWLKISGYTAEDSDAERVRTTRHTLYLDETPIVVDVTTEYGASIKRRWDIIDNRDLAFDHARAIVQAYLALRRALKLTDIAYCALPQVFEYEEMCSLYSAAFMNVPEEIENLHRIDSGLTFLP